MCWPQVNDILITTEGNERQVHVVIAELRANTWRRPSAGAGAHGPPRPRPHSDPDPHPLAGAGRGHRLLADARSASRARQPRSLPAPRLAGLLCPHHPWMLAHGRLAIAELLPQKGNRRQRTQFVSDVVWCCHLVPRQIVASRGEHDLRGSWTDSLAPAEERVGVTRRCPAPGPNARYAWRSVGRSP